MTDNLDPIFTIFSSSKLKLLPKIERKNFFDIFEKPKTQLKPCSISQFLFNKKICLIIMWPTFRCKKCHCNSGFSETSWGRSTWFLLFTPMWQRKIWWRRWRRINITILYYLNPHAVGRDSQVHFSLCNFLVNIIQLISFKLSFQ